VDSDILQLFEPVAVHMLNPVVPSVASGTLVYLVHFLPQIWNKPFFQGVLGPLFWGNGIDVPHSLSYRDVCCCFDWSLFLEPFFFLIYQEIILIFSIKV